MEKPCRRCLLSDMKDEDLKDSIQRSIEQIEANDRADEKTYQERLNFCRSCDNLISGTCLSCGCYVEIRAAIKKGRCPSKKW
ncbi:MAG: hypothetical protein J6Y08_09985 [Clostridiales bacterium]|nr:hypothetical protein [Clostridiales bacterium]